MVIQHTGSGTFVIKTKAADIETGTDTTISGIVLMGPGEYEVGDVRVKGYPKAYLFSAEGLNVLAITNSDGLEESVLNAIEDDIDVLLLPVDEKQESVKNAVKIMNTIDPAVTIPSVNETTHPFCTQVGSCPEPIAELKIHAKDLEEDGRKVVLLHARSGTRS